jgi:hypothetical protein
MLHCVNIVQIILAAWLNVQTSCSGTFVELKYNYLTTAIGKDGTFTSRTDQHRNVKALQEFKVAAYFKLFDENDNVDSAMVQRLAAFLMAVREINNKTDGIGDDILPDTKLLVALESPDDSIFGVEAALADSILTAFQNTGKYDLE